jgi:hypothetical protein
MENRIKLDEEDKTVQRKAFQEIWDQKARLLRTMWKSRVASLDHAQRQRRFSQRRARFGVGNAVVSPIFNSEA